ncbi:MAG: dihydroorotase family protein [Xanthobacteraceae bacterium]|nr:dihydroorotase family protein [Xanthobacteraceae bacterium]
MYDLVIRNGLVASGEGLWPAHVAVRDGRVAALLEPAATPQANRTIDATGRILLPGLVDAHVHFREPGLTHKEDFASGGRAAALGGVTTVMVMPTDSPVTMTAEQFVAKKELAEGRCAVDFALQAAVGPDPGNVSALAREGAVSFEVFLGLLPDPVRVTTSAALVDVLAAVGEVDGVVGVTPFDDELAAAAARRASESLANDRERFAAAMPPSIEAAGIARAVAAHRIAGGRLHVRQVSSELGLAALALAAEGVTSEVTPHNLWLTNETLLSLGPVAKVVPPLRSREDVEAMRRALAVRQIDIVATDHAPHTREEKAAGEADLGKAPGGFPGVQTLLPLLLKLVGDGVIGYPDLVRVACELPAEIFRLSDRKGSLRPGMDADVVLVDPETPMQIRNADQLSRAGQTPFDGWTCPATPVLTLLRGDIIAEQGRIVGSPRGRFLAPS